VTNEAEEIIDITLDRALLRISAEEAIERKRAAGYLALYAAAMAADPEDLHETEERWDGGE
jgi:hypothetical protein